MTDGIVQVPVDSTGKKIDTSELTVGAATVERQRIVVADPTSAANLATVSAGGALKTDSSGSTQPISASSLPLPAGASTETTLASVNTATGAQADAEAAGNGSLIAILKRIRTLLNGGLPTLASGRLPVDPSGVTSPVSAASLPLPTGAAQDATLTGGTAKAINRGGAKGATTAADVTSTASGADHQAIDAVLYDASGNRLGTSSTPIRTDPTGSTTQPISGTVAATQSGNWNTGARASSTATLTNVASSATSVSLLASNANRLGIIIVNDSTQSLFVKFGATASATSYTYLLTAGQTLELPTASSVIYTGAIDGIWASANGNARVTELT